jgi:hypothetical protein
MSGPRKRRDIVKPYTALRAANNEAPAIADVALPPPAMTLTAEN